ncbi:MAG TPA: hypothetical protein DCR46_07140, partial [Cytophagales bacterium]|nr:hypothetical protein [Cytophagales bacterium]
MSSSLRNAFVMNADIFKRLSIFQPLSTSAGFYDANCDVDSIMLQADDPAPSFLPSSLYSVGTWSQISGPNALTFSNVNDPNATLKGLVSGDYLLRWTLTKSGCPVRADTALITVRKSPSANAGNDTSLCSGTSVKLKGSSLLPFETGTWLQVSGPNTATIVSPNSPVTNVSGLVLGVYRFSWNVTTGVGCNDAADTVTINNNQTPAITSASLNPNPVCEGFPVNFSLTVLNPLVAYDWIGPNGFSFSHNGAQPLPVILNAATTNTGAYSVTATLNGCKSPPFNAGNLVVTPKPPKSIITPSENPICQNQALTLTASGTAPVTWTLPSGAKSTTNPLVIPKIQIAQAGKYKVIANVGECLSDVDSVNIVVKTSLNPTILASGTGTYCVGDAISLTASPLIDNAVYAWVKPVGSSLSGSGNVLSTNAAILPDSGDYLVTISSNGCKDSSIVKKIFVKTLPNQPGAITPTQVCAGTTGFVVGVPNDPTVTYAWSLVGSPADVSMLPPTNKNTVTMNVGVNAPASFTVQVFAIAAGCTSLVRTQVITVNPIPQVTASATPNPVCQNSNLQLEATELPGATYAWTSTPAGFTSTDRRPSQFNSSVVGTVEYTVVATSGTGCQSPPSAVKVETNAPPTSPSDFVLPVLNPVCAGQTGVNYSVVNDPSVSYVWNYTGTGVTFAIPTNLNSISVDFASSATSGNLEVRSVALGCTSSVRSVAISVNPLPATPIPTATPNPVCVGNPFIISANAIANTYTWTLPNASTLSIQNINKLNAVLSDSGNYTLVVADAAGCKSLPGNIYLKVVPVFIPSIGSNSPVCAGTSLNLTASIPIGGVANYEWTLPGGSKLNTQNLTVNPVALSDSGTYEVVATVNSCPSQPQTIKVSVKPIPATPSILGKDTVCQGAKAQVYAVNPVASDLTYNWAFTGTGVTFTTGTTGSSVTLDFSPTASAGSLQVTAISSTCSSAVKSMPIVIKPLPTTAKSLDTLKVCEKNTISLISPIFGINYAWSGPNGFSSILQNPVIPNATSVNSGLYVVTLSANGCEGERDSTFVVVKPLPDATFTYPKNNYCQSEVNPKPISIPFGSSFTVQPGGLNLNSSTGEIILKSSLPGAYTILNSITNQGCTDTASFKINLFKVPVARRFNYSSPICDASSESISPNFTTAGDAGTFTSFPLGLSIDPVSGNILPSSSTSGTYRVVNTATLGGCTDTTSALVTILPSPSKPTLAGVSPVCQGQTSTLTATSGSIANFDWFGNGALVKSGGNTFQVSVEADFYVVANGANGCKSLNSDTIKFKIISKPAVPVINGVCVAAPPAKLSTQYSVGYAFQWYKNNIIEGTSDTLIANNSAQYKVVVKETTTGCSSDTSVSVDPFSSFIKISIVSGSIPFCSGDSIVVSSNSPLGNTWTLDGVQIATTPITTVKTSGKLVLNVNNGSCIGEDSIQITTNPSPAKPSILSASDSICPGNSLRLSTNSVGNFQWIANGIEILGANTDSLIVNQTGAYKVRVTLGTCSAMSDVKNIGIRSAPSKPLLS